MLTSTWIAGKDLMKHHYHLNKNFYSELTLEDITDKEYDYAQKCLKKKLWGSHKELPFLPERRKLEKDEKLL